MNDDTGDDDDDDDDDDHDHDDNFCGHGSSKKKGQLKVGRARVLEPTQVTVFFRRLVKTLSLIMTGSHNERPNTCASLGKEVYCLLQAALLFAIADGNAGEVEQAHHYLTLALLTVHPLQHSYSADLRSSAVSNETLLRSLDALLQYIANLQQRAADFITAEVGWEVGDTAHNRCVLHFSY
jgi:hypothetical protein